MKQALTRQEEQVAEFLTNLIWYGGMFTLPILILTYMKRKKRT